ncbi:bacterioferritin-associated ferredoxin [Klebsiella pneumoniae subsp. ozaenae]|uniref:Bacterioferritin-associated ferredoxin n=1 Tax=Klebsiella pneumoniae subsp. ozaenae TaxID=574 RepID=A0A377YXN6_KLEPO|nr:bacterioferritin-associated ferredoxin [Klebsiella pneumoniae subsp. ozaenae]
MYVCLCNGVSDKKIRQVVRQFQPQSFQQLRKFVPVGNQCGKCVRAAREVMEDELTTMRNSKKSPEVHASLLTSL